jgi:CPA2 family monovalent cation:H+ antiporter-2
MMGIAADFVLIVVAGFCGALLARALRLPLLVGYVAAGVVIGPHTAGPSVVEAGDIELLAEIGAALLLFSLGLEVSLRDLRAVGRVALIGGPIQILLTAAAAAGAGVRFLSMSPTESVWFGAMVAVSSTMVVVKTLNERGVATTLASRVMIGLLVLQDLAVIPMLIILPQLGNLQSAAGKLAGAIGIAAAFLAAVIFTGTRLLPGLIRRILIWGPRELFLVAVVAAGVGTGFATHLIGLSFALGAFVAGIILSESEFSHQALSDLAPLRDIFGLLFFVSVGMLLDPRYVAAHWRHIAAAVVLIFLGKAVILGGIARSFGYVNMAPWIVGLGLSQTGEFSFVLARSGVRSQMISQATYDLVLACTVLTMALSPVVSSAALPLGRAWRRWQKPSRVLPVVDPIRVRLENHVVLAGYGRSGQAAADALRAAGIPTVIIEQDHALYRDAIEAGFKTVWGDVTGEEVLHAACIDQARVLLLTPPDPVTVLVAAARARRGNPGLAIIARATRAHHLAELRAHGVDTAVLPEFEGGIEMVRQTLTRFNLDQAGTARTIDGFRTRFYQRD